MAVNMATNTTLSRTLNRTATGTPDTETPGKHRQDVLALHWQTVTSGTSNRMLQASGIAPACRGADVVLAVSYRSTQIDDDRRIERETVAGDGRLAMRARPGGGRRLWSDRPETGLCSTNLIQTHKTL